MYYTKGDAPAAPLVVVPSRDGDAVELELYVSAVATLTNPDGSVLEAAAAIVDLDDPDGGSVSVTLPQLLQSGIVQVTVQLLAAGGRSDRFECPPIAVQELDGWHTISSAHGEWPGSTGLDDGRLYVLLETAKREVAVYAPTLEPGARPPVSYREAQLLHARNRNAAAAIDPATGDGGTDGFSSGPFPLDWTVKQLVRPQRRMPSVR